MNYSIYSTRFGFCLIAVIDNKLCSIEFSQYKTQDVSTIIDNLEKSFKNKYSKILLLDKLDFLEGKYYEVYFSIHDNRDVSKTPYIQNVQYLTGTPFQRKVWDALRTIPYGKTITYKQLAEQVGAPKAHRAVATACKLNPMPVIIPCHRVVPSSGGIGNYALGVEMKKALLDREKNEAIP